MILFWGGFGGLLALNLLRCPMTCLDTRCPAVLAVVVLLSSPREGGPVGSGRGKEETPVIQVCLKHPVIHAI